MTYQPDDYARFSVYCGWDERKAGADFGKGKANMAELKANGTCDFCGEACNADPHGAKAYDCEDFPMALTGEMSYGAWGACPSCEAFVEDENWDALEKRMTSIQRRRFGFLAELMLPRLRQMHAQQIQLFRQHRTDVGSDVPDHRKAGMTGTFEQGGRQ